MTCRQQSPGLPTNYASEKEQQGFEPPAFEASLPWTGPPSLAVRIEWGSGRCTVPLQHLQCIINRQITVEVLYRNLHDVHNRSCPGRTTQTHKRYTYRLKCRFPGSAQPASISDKSQKLRVMVHLRSRISETDRTQAHLGDKTGNLLVTYSHVSVASFANVAQSARTCPARAG